MKELLENTNLQPDQTRKNLQHFDYRNVEDW